MLRIPADIQMTDTERQRAQHFLPKKESECLHINSSIRNTF